MHPIRQWDVSPLAVSNAKEDIPPMTEAPATPLARAIQARMRALGIGQKHLALRAGLNETYVRDLLKGRSRNPIAANLAKLARALECDLTDLLQLSAAPQNSELVSDPLELCLLATWRELPEQERESVLDFIEFRLRRLTGRGPRRGGNQV